MVHSGGASALERWWGRASACVASKAQRGAAGHQTTWNRGSKRRPLPALRARPRPRPSNASVSFFGYLDRRHGGLEQAREGSGAFRAPGGSAIGARGGERGEKVLHKVLTAPPADPPPGPARTGGLLQLARLAG